MHAEPSAELDDLAYRVIGAAIDVHRSLGPGYLERLYEEALVVELRDRGIPLERQVPLKIEYKGRAIGEMRIDLVVGGQLVVELKSVDALASVHTAQLLSYLKAGGFRLGLLMNFNVRLLPQGIRRVIARR